MASPPLRVFISYAHDPKANAAFVDRVRARLEREGIETWIDTDRIKQGDAWREAIVEGIAGCHQTIAFLSKQSVRDPGVCLDELAIALHEHGAIVPVLIEPAAAIDAPHHVSGAQWVDMSGHGTGDDAWFEAKCAELLAILTALWPTTAPRRSPSSAARCARFPRPPASRRNCRVSSGVSGCWTLWPSGERRKD